MVKCNEKDNQSICRSFKIIGSGIGYMSPPSSYYKGKDPMSVANKFGTMLFKLINSKTNKKGESNPYYKFNKQKMIKIIIKETTRTSSKPTFYYKVEREDKPTTRTLPDGTVIVNKYKIKSHKCSANEDAEMKRIEEQVIINKNTNTENKSRKTKNKNSNIIMSTPDDIIMNVPKTTKKVANTLNKTMKTKKNVSNNTNNNLKKNIPVKKTILKEDVIVESIPL